MRLESFEIVLGYDPSAVSLSNFRAGPLLSNFVISARVDPSSGRVDISGSTLADGVSLAPGIAGPMVLFDAAGLPGWTGSIGSAAPTSPNRPLSAALRAVDEVLSEGLATDAVPAIRNLLAAVQNVEWLGVVPFNPDDLLPVGQKSKHHKA